MARREEGLPPVPYQPTITTAHRALIPGGGGLAGDRGSALNGPADIAESRASNLRCIGLRPRLLLRVQIVDQINPALRERFVQYLIVVNMQHLSQTFQ